MIPPCSDWFIQAERFSLGHYNRLMCCRPPEFAVKESNPDEGIPADMLPPSDDEGEEGELTVVNTNRRQIATYEESEEESEEDEEEAKDINRLWLNKEVY